MEWKLELVVVPVSDVARAKRFYSEQVGFAVDHDTRVDDDMHIVQLTPPGSACSIAIGKGMVETPPGSVQGLQLVVPDIQAARASWSNAAWRSARSSTTRAPTWSTAPATAGTPSSSSPTPTATAGPSRSARPNSRQEE